MEITTIEKPYTWANRIIEIASKSLRIIHIDMQRWNLGAAGIRKDNIRLNFNIESGASTAHETQVTSTIALEAINSPLFSGAPIEELKEGDNVLVERGIRYWKIENELPYQYQKKNTKNPKRVDLLVQRYYIEKAEIDNHKTYKVDTNNIEPPVYIEAKRAKRYKNNLLSDNVIEEFNNQFTPIKKDIIKLHKEKKKLEKKGKNMFSHLLIWGVHKTKESILNGEERELTNDEQIVIQSSNPEGFLNKMKDHFKGDKDLENITLNLFKTRWLPYEWEDKKLSSCPDKIQKWLWVSLIEVEF